MNLPEFSIRKPVTTTLLMAAILVAGYLGYRELPVSDLPNVDFPTISVSARLPGASPETMASSVATPLEKEFSTISGIDSMTSSSALGSTQVTLQFNLSRDLDAAAQDVQSAISAVLRQLPSNMPAPPTYRKVNPADQPILYLALTSPTLPLQSLDEYGETLMAPRISMVKGVAQVQVFGGQKYAVRVQVDPSRLASRGIGIDEVAQAVRTANVNLPTGILHGREQAWSVESEGQLTRAEAYDPIIVAYRDGNPVRLSDVGEAIDGVENDKVAAWFVNQRGIILAVQRQPGSNTVQVADDVKRLLPTFRAQLPASVSVHVLYDRSEPIRESVEDVGFTLLLSLALTVFVIFLFLRNVRATLIPSLALPLSVIGTFSAMHLLDYSVDNLSLMALTLSIGFVVDDAIVMLENIVRHLEMGKTPLRAAIDGSREVGFTILSMTFSLVAVFIPVLFMGGIIGRLFNEFAVTISVAILISGLVSLTLTPLLGRMFLKSRGEVKHGRLFAASEKVFDGMLRFYAFTLRGAMRHRRTTMAVAIGSVFATLWLFRIVPLGFLPSEDRGQVLTQTEAAEGTSFETMVRLQREAAAVVEAQEGVRAFMCSAGGRGGMSASNTGFFFIGLTERGERRKSADEIVQDLRRKLSAIPGLRAYPQNPPILQVGARASQGQYQFTLQSADLEELNRDAPRMEARLRTIPLLLDVNSDLKIRNPQVNVEIDRDRAATLDVSVERIEAALGYAFASSTVSTIYAPGDTYDVLLEVRPEDRRRPEALARLHVRSARGEMVPLQSLVRLNTTVGPLTVNHSGQLPSVTMSFNLAPGVALGDAVEAVEAAAREVLPPSITTSFQGTAQAFKDSMSNMGLLLVMAVAVIYMVLGILYESFIHPITILSGLPSAAIGALLTLMLFGMDLSLYGLVGVIMLLGIVKKNGIMMVDFALDAARNEGKPAYDAMYEACLVRFRPIMMTTVSTVAAAIPIAVGYGAGGEARQPLGLAVVGGLLLSQVLTLYVTPVFYLYMDAFTRWLRRGKPAGGPATSGDA